MLFQRFRQLKLCYHIAHRYCHKINLTKQLVSKIKIGGPISIADYMKEVLVNPLSGYYMHRDVFGAEGDFVTSPELTQMFGELLAVWFLNEWSKAGSPKPVQIVELGPGRGTLCQDILRVFGQFDVLHKTTVHLVEVSPHLTELQAKNLCLKVEVSKDTTYMQCGMTKQGAPIYWYNHLDLVPKEFTLFLAHEFFDALPIHQFKHTDKGYREVLVDIDPSTEGNFRFVLSSDETVVGRLFVDRKETRPYVEVSPEGLSVAQKIGNRIQGYGGLALIVDYGHDGFGVDTFRAFKNHGLHNPLIEPGSADLTADVDFTAIKKALLKDNDVLVFGPISQRNFLTNMGVNYRLEKLMKDADPRQKESLNYSYRMLVDKDKMGERFKVLGVVPQTLSMILNKYPVSGFS